MSAEFNATFSARRPRKRTSSVVWKGTGADARKRPPPDYFRYVCDECGSKTKVDQNDANRCPSLAGECCGMLRRLV